MAIAEPSIAVIGPNLKQRLARAERVNRLKAQALILPLVLFLLLVRALGDKQELAFSGGVTVMKIIGG